MECRIEYKIYIFKKKIGGNFLQYSNSYFYILIEKIKSKIKYRFCSFKREQKIENKNNELNLSLKQNIK